MYPYLVYGVNWEGEHLIILRLVAAGNHRIVYFVTKVPLMQVGVIEGFFALKCYIILPRLSLRQI